MNSQSEAKTFRDQPSRNQKSPQWISGSSDRNYGYPTVTQLRLQRFKV